MSLPQIEHNCESCVKQVPECGLKRRVKEGFCTRWVGVKP